MVRFCALPGPTTLNAERKLLGSSEAGTGGPALKGIPYGVGEIDRVPRQTIQLIHLGIQNSSTVVPNLEPSGVITDRHRYGR